jgi:DNA-binding NarL/FixJ family response regulator
MIDVGIIEDDGEIREAIRDFLDEQADLSCVVAAESMEEFFGWLGKNMAPQVTLVDIGLPGMSGIDGIRLIKERSPETDIVMLTIHDDPEHIFNSLRAGASGYLLKNTPFHQIKKAIEEIHVGGAPMSPDIARKVVSHFQLNSNRNTESPLTQKEKEIVIGLVDGLSYKMIGGRLDITLQTVRVHIKNIYKKLHTHSKAEVITKSLRGEI